MEIERDNEQPAAEQPTVRWDPDEAARRLAAAPAVPVQPYADAPPAPADDDLAPPVFDDLPVPEFAVMDATNIRDAAPPPAPAAPRSWRPFALGAGALATGLLVAVLALGGGGEERAGTQRAAAPTPTPTVSAPAADATPSPQATATAPQTTPEPTPTPKAKTTPTPRPQREKTATPDIPSEHVSPAERERAEREQRPTPERTPQPEATPTPQPEQEPAPEDAAESVLADKTLDDTKAGLYAQLKGRTLRISIGDKTPAKHRNGKAGELFRVDCALEGGREWSGLGRWKVGATPATLTLPKRVLDTATRCSLTGPTGGPFDWTMPAGA